MRAQRVRAAEIRAEMQAVKWTAEGVLNSKIRAARYAASSLAQ